jgi:hypothetical protein
MKRIACFVGASLIVFACAPGPGAKCAQEAPAPASKESGAVRRRFVAIQPASPESLDDFPLLVRLDPQHIDYAACAEGGADVRFVDRAGAVLAHEIEEWNPGGTSTIWVRVPKIEPKDAGFYLQYGARAAPAASSEVWTAPYRAVWHFAGNAKDATSRHHDGADVKARFVAGRVGKGAALDSGAKEYVKLGEDTMLVSGARGVTVSAWVQHAGQVRDNQDIVIGIGTAKKEGHLSRVSVAVSPELGFVGEANPDETRWQVNESAPSTSPNGEWHYWTVVIDVAGKSITLFRDGSQLGAPLAGAWSAQAFPDSPSNRVTIGCEEDKTKSYFNGVIDELRVETIARGPAWIAAQARAVTGDLVSIGPEETSFK